RLFFNIGWRSSTHFKRSYETYVRNEKASNIFSPLARLARKYFSLHCVHTCNVPHHGDFTIAGGSLRGEMNLDDGEAVVLIVSIAVTLVAGSGYYLRLQRVARFSCPPGQRVPLYLAPPLSLGLLGVVLLRCAAGDVRGGGIYFALFMALGGAWIFATLALCGCLGVDFRSDALENHNSAVIIALSGVIIGVTLAYAGGNIGEGDSIWQTIFSSALATLGWLLSWCLLDGLTHTSIAVAESRDKASAWRLAGFLVASGLILGR